MKDPSTPRSTWTESEKRAFTIKVKAMNALFCGLNENEYNIVSLYQSAQEIWLLLGVKFMSVLMKLKSLRLVTLLIYMDSLK